MRYQYHDGGRAEAGFKGQAGDCACRAIAIAAHLPYSEVYDRLATFCKATDRPGRGRKRGISHPRTGIHKATMRRFMDCEMGWLWHPTMTIGSGARVKLLRNDLPPSRIICNVSRHYCAVVDGVVLDTDDPRRDGTRTVYGFWIAGV